MKFYPFISFLLIMSFMNLNAQVETLAEIQINGSGKAIFTHDHTGIPIIQADASYTAINPETHEKIWEVERSSSAALLEAADTDGGGPADYTDIYQTPFAYIRGTVVNVQTGQVIVDGEKDGIKRFMEYYIIPDADLLLLQLGAKGKIRLYGIDPFTSELKWDVDLRDMSALSQQIATDNPSGYTIPPLFTASGDLLYHNGKNLASINLKNGSLNWNEKLNPGYIFINDDATKLLVAEKRGAIGGAMSLSAGGTAAPSKFSKKMYLIDAATGKSLWSKGDSKMDGNIKFIKPYDGGYLVIHDEGFNIFDYNEGKQAEGRWKKDTGFKNIKDIVIEDEGFMVYFKNRRMLVDPKSGDELWKKEEKLERERPDYVMSRRGYITEVGSSSFYREGNRIYVTTNGRTRNYLCEGYVINDDKNELITFSNDAYSNDNGYYYITYAINLSSGESKRTSFHIRKGIDEVNYVKDGYFFYNDRGYALLSYNGSEWGKPKKEYYPDPSRGERFLKGLAVGVIGASASLQNTGNYLVSNDPNAAANYRAKQDAMDSVDASSLYTRKRVGRVEADFAYFFSRKDGQLILFKVDKNTGKEVKEFPFEDNSPVYEIDSWNDQLFYLVKDQLKIFKL